MARLFLIIDGYNLMHAAGFGKSRYGPGDLERARNRLITRLSSLLPQSLASDTVLVFDAADATLAEGEPSRIPVTRFKICFSAEGRDADSEIELMLGTHSSPRQILVISSDHRLHKAASRRKARGMDSEVFLDILETPETAVRRLQPPAGKSTSKVKASRPRETKHGDAKPPAEAVDDLHAEFLKIDVSELKRAVRKEKKP